MPGKDGWYVVGSAFQEGNDGPMDLDLYGESDEEGSYNWNAGHDEQIERRVGPV